MSHVHYNTEIYVCYLWFAITLRLRSTTLTNEISFSNMVYF